MVEVIFPGPLGVSSRCKLQTLGLLTVSGAVTAHGSPFSKSESMEPRVSSTLKPLGLVLEVIFPSFLPSSDGPRVPSSDGAGLRTQPLGMQDMAERRAAEEVVQRKIRDPAQHRKQAEGE